MSVSVAATVVTAWAVGQRNAKDGGGGLDYIVRPLRISPIAFAVAGVISIVLYVAAIAYLLRSERHPPARDRWKVCVIILTVIGVTLGAGYRIVTAGVIGANIGGGGVVLFGLPFCVFLAVVAAVVAPRARDRVGTGFPR